MAHAVDGRQGMVNLVSSYAIEGLIEGVAVGGIAGGFGLIDPVFSTLYAFCKIGIGTPLNYFCDSLFDNEGANTASKVMNFILKNGIPLLVSFSIAYLLGYPITFTAIAVMGSLTIAAAISVLLGEKAVKIIELGLDQYFQ